MLAVVPCKQEGGIVPWAGTLGTRAPPSLDVDEVVVISVGQAVQGACECAERRLGPGGLWHGGEPSAWLSPAGDDHVFTVIYVFEYFAGLGLELTYAVCCHFGASAWVLA